MTSKSYMKGGEQNTQADALSQLPTNGKALSMEDDEMPCFMAIELEDPQYAAEALPEHCEEDADVDRLLASRDAFENPLPGNLLPVSLEELIREQFGDPSCTRISACLSGEEDLPFRLNDKSYLVRMVKARPRILVPHSLQLRMLHLSHNAPIESHPNGRKLYLTLRRDL